MQKASGFVEVHNNRYKSLEELTEAMSTKGLEYDYQVAWMDLLNSPAQSILSLANHCEAAPGKKCRTYVVPKLPVSLIHAWNMKLFNKAYLSRMQTDQCLSLEQFNNPLDKIQYWNRLYGPKGLIQVQSVFAQEKATETLHHLLQIIKNNNATPTLAVLKLFTKLGDGLLSFCQPGFTLAIDFIHNQRANKAIKEINQYICSLNGKVYLAKDLLLTKELFQTMYPNQLDFKRILTAYKCTLNSDLAKRLGITQ